MWGNDEPHGGKARMTIASKPEGPPQKGPEQPKATWLVLLIEDNEQMRKDILEELQDAEIGGRTIVVRPVEDFQTALDEVRERRADLVILDVYRDTPMVGGDPAGLAVLDELQNTGFVSVILYTAHPEGAKGRETPFVKVVGKDDAGVAKLRTEVEFVFNSRLPHLFRAIVSHFDRTLRDYMWGFVQQRWDSLAQIGGQPEFLRILLRRLAASLSREGIDQIAAEAFGDSGEKYSLEHDQAHPAEYYTMPPIGDDVRFGDIRVIENDGGSKEIRVIVWPSCDLVTTGGRTLKVDKVSCALAVPLADLPEMKDWAAAPGDTSKRKAVAAVIRNQRRGKGLSDERFHYLPAFGNIPDIVIDFREVDRLPVANVTKSDCLATVASPFAELIAARYVRYIGRPGVPDLDSEGLLNRLEASIKTPK
jgi:CheY-like chemotaxis protein